MPLLLLLPPLDASDSRCKTDEVEGKKRDGGMQRRDVAVASVYVIGYSRLKRLGGRPAAGRLLQGQSQAGRQAAQGSSRQQSKEVRYLIHNSPFR